MDAQRHGQVGRSGASASHAASVTPIALRALVLMAAWARGERVEVAWNGARVMPRGEQPVRGDAVGAANGGELVDARARDAALPVAPLSAGGADSGGGELLAQPQALPQES